MDRNELLAIVTFIEELRTFVERSFAADLKLVEPQGLGQNHTIAKAIGRCEAYNCILEFLNNYIKIQKERIQ